MTPETWGAAMLVPVSSRYLACSLLFFEGGAFPGGSGWGDAAAAFAGSPASAGGDDCSGGPRLRLNARRRCVESAEMIFSPGATRSGLRRPSPVGPFEEK